MTWFCNFFYLQSCLFEEEFSVSFNSFSVNRITLDACFRSCNGLPFFLGFHKFQHQCYNSINCFEPSFVPIYLKTYSTPLFLVAHFCNNLIYYQLVLPSNHFGAYLHSFLNCILEDFPSVLLQSLLYWDLSVLAGKHLLSFFIQLNPLIHVESWLTSPKLLTRRVPRSATCLNCAQISILKVV